MQHLLLTIHILSAAVWLGGSFMIGFAGPRMAKAGGPAAGAWLRVVLDAGPKFFAPAAVLALLSGSLLVTTNEAWDWGHQFVWIGIIIVVLVLGIGFVFNKPALERALEAAAEGDLLGAASNAQRAAMGGLVMTLLLVAAEVLMVTRFGTG